MSAPLAPNPGPVPEQLRPALGPSSPSAIAHELRRHRYVIRDEATVQAAIAEILEARGVQFRREQRLSARDRIDFLTEDGTGIEVKVAGSFAMVHRQLARYGRHDAVARLLLVTTRQAHVEMPLTVGGVSVLVEKIRSVR